MCYINVQSGEMHGIFKKKKKQARIWKNTSTAGWVSSNFLRNICKENKHISYSETVLRNKLMLRADKVVKNFE